MVTQDFVEPLDEQEQPATPASLPTTTVASSPDDANAQASEPTRESGQGEVADDVSSLPPPAQDAAYPPTEKEDVDTTPAAPIQTQLPAVGVATAAPIAAPSANQEAPKTIEPVAASPQLGDAKVTPASPAGKVPPAATEITPVGTTPTATSTEEDEPARRSFKDRLAAFNAPAGAAAGSRGPPPPIKPKPAPAAGSWAWKQKQQQQQQPADSTGTSASADAATVPVTASGGSAGNSANESQQQQGSSSGMSASDAKESITKGMSLKERMAALQQASAAPAQPSPGGPPAVGAKPRVWKRPEAPPAPAQEPVSPGATAADEQPSLVAPAKPTELEGGEGDAAGADDAGQPSVEDEERAERERRAAIAARMQRLGARGMGVGGAFGGAAAAPAPAAPAAAKPAEPTVSESEQAEEQPPAAELAATSEAPEANAQVAQPRSTDEPAITSPGAGPTSIAMPAIPKRAGPPKRRGAPAPTRSDSKASTSSANEPTTPIAVKDMSRLEVPETVPPQFDESDVSGGPDVEIPKPKDEEEQRLDREAEDLGRGPRGAEGAAAAGMTLAAVQQEPKLASSESSNTQPEVGDEEIESAQESGGPDTAATDTPMAAPTTAAPKSTLPPPPPPAGGFSDDEEASDADDDDDVDIMKQASAGGLQLQPSQRDVEEGLDEPADVTSPTDEVSSPTDRALGMQSLGLPKDEVALKKQQEDEEELGSDGEELPPPPPARPISASSPSSKPAGPRPLPSTPERQTVLPQPTQVGVPLPADQGEPESSGPSPVITDEPAADPEAQRRAGIAARMAKLGGIKLGGPPLMGTRRSTNDASEGPRSPMSPGAEPTSPVREAPLAPSLQTAAEEEDDETEEAAARRRQATLARLQAGGSLGQGMFGGPRPVAEADARDEELAESAPLPVPEQPVTEEAAAEEVEEEEEDEEEAPPPPPARAPPVQDAAAERADDPSEDDEPPPPPPVRPAQRQASVPVPVTEALSAPKEKLAAPIETPAALTAEPEEEAEVDEPPPPPPPRDIQRSNTAQSRSSISSPTTPAFGQIQRSETAQSRTSTSSDNASARRPGYNELQQAASQHGQRVLAAVNKLAGKRGATVGVSLNALGRAISH